MKRFNLVYCFAWVVLALALSASKCGSEAPNEDSESIEDIGEESDSTLDQELDSLDTDQDTGSDMDSY